MKHPPKTACKDQLENAIEQWVVLSLNAKRDREIMRRRLIDGEPIDGLASDYYLSADTIRQIIDKWTDTIFDHID